MCDHSWLPPGLAFVDEGGGWPAHWDALHARFCKDLVEHTPVFHGLPVRVPKSRDDEGKLTKFVHVATGHWKLDPANEREIKLGRCSTVTWIRPMIEAVGGQRGVRAWREWYQQKSEFRWSIALQDFCHLVILAERPNAYYLVTAYPVEEQHQRDGLRRRFERETRPPKKS